ncbi:hypothetical protein V6C03_03475 [Methyloligella sp. 2.7D]|uniref:hypothetical protein n=1 Tax=unclassified Methyloligella TaxID=2625955 RepID=UPI00157BC6C7|nr:hypothetical protein [Methyloligella sp. GL2]QKP76325.1 hypothetical protein HT051_01950 [Methyloligella sp. GL2]
MPLHMGKIASIIALLTIGAFVVWLMIGSLLTGETAEEEDIGALPAAGSSLLASGPAFGQKVQRIGA